MYGPKGPLYPTVIGLNRKMEIMKYLNFGILVLSFSFSSNASSLDEYCTKYKEKRFFESEVAKYNSQLLDKDVNVRGSAALNLSCFPEHIETSIPRMINLFNEPNGEARASMQDSVANFKEKSVPYLIDALSNKDKDIRRSACVTLRQLGPIAKSAIPALTELLKEPGYDVSMSAQRAIKSIERK